jgi:hypothetical protein
MLTLRPRMKNVLRGGGKELADASNADIGDLISQQFGLSALKRRNNDMIKALTRPDKVVAKFNLYYDKVAEDAGLIWKRVYNKLVADGDGDDEVGAGMPPEEAYAVANAYTENFIRGEMMLMEYLFPYSFGKKKEMKHDMADTDSGRNLHAIKKIVKDLRV